MQILEPSMVYMSRNLKLEAELGLESQVFQHGTATILIGVLTASPNGLSLSQCVLKLYTFSLFVIDIPLREMFDVRPVVPDL